jgi:APA family basic amino acid/polyamine antiporter
VTTEHTRALGFWRSWAIVVGGMIGSAIFMMPAVLAPYGGLGLVSWASAAVGAILVALTFASLARRVTTPGGPYAYAHAAFGDFIGFLIAWGYWISLWAAGATVAIGFTAYFGALVPAVGAGPFGSITVGLIVLWTLVGVNLLGARGVGILGVVTTVLKLLPLAIIGTIGLFYVDRGTLPPMNPTTDGSLHVFASVFALTFWTFLGMEVITIPSEDVIAPERTIPRAVVAGVVTVAAIYLLVGFVALGTVPGAELQASSSPLADVGRRMAGSWGGTAVAAGALVSAFGCLNAVLLATSHMAAAAARDGLFPRALARMTSRHAPGVSLVVTGVMISALLIMNQTRGLVGAYRFILLISTLTSVVPYAFSAMAALILDVHDHHQPPGRRAREGLTATLAFGVCIWVIASAGPETVYWGFLLLMAGLPVYVAVTRQRESL